MAGRILALIIKELLALLRDKKSRTVLIIPPMIQLFVFSFAATQEAKNLTLAVLNQDRGVQAVELEQRFAAASAFSTILHLQTAAEVAPTIDRQRAIAVLWIPADFSRKLARGEEAPVQLILDGRKTNTTQLVGGYANRILAQYRADLGQPPQVTLAVRNWFNPNLDFTWFTVPSLVCVLCTLIGLLVTGMSVAREREMGTFDQLLVSPLRPLEILIGKALPALLVAVVEGSLILLAATLVLRIPFSGSLLLLYGSMTVFLCAVIGIGLFISSLCTTQQQAVLGTFVFMSPAMILSGFASPIENMPGWLQTFTLINPLRYFMVIVRGVFLKGMPAGAVWDRTWPMMLIAVATLSAAAWLFKRRME